MMNYYVSSGWPHFVLDCSPQVVFLCVHSFPDVSMVRCRASMHFPRQQQKTQLMPLLMQSLHGIRLTTVNNGKSQKRDAVCHSMFCKCRNCCLSTMHFTSVNKPWKNFPQSGKGFFVVMLFWDDCLEMIAQLPLSLWCRYVLCTLIFFQQITLFSVTFKDNVYYYACKTDLAKKINLFTSFYGSWEACLS